MTINKVVCGEYSSFYITDTNQVYGWDLSTGTGPKLIGFGNLIVDGSAGLHHSIFLDDQHTIWTYMDNGSGQRGNGTTGGNGAPFNVLLDSNGNPFTSITQVATYMATNFVLKADGTIWYWGQDYLNVYGTANILAPKQLSYPVPITKIVIGRSILAIDINGGVWEWTIGSKTPIKITLPGTAEDIGIIDRGVSLAIVGGNPYAWGVMGAYVGLYDNTGTGVYGIKGVVALKDIWKLAAPIKQLICNDNTLHYIDSNSDLWGMGQNSNGEVGNGKEHDFANANPPYAWDWMPSTDMVKVPIQVLPGTKFAKVSKGAAYAFYVFAQDIKGNWYSWGRNKSDVLGNGLRNMQDDIYPNLLDQPKPIIVTPLTNISRVVSFTEGQSIYTANTGFFKSTTTTTSTTKATTTTSTSTSTTTTTTSSTTTTTTTKAPYIILYKDGTWILA